MSSCCPLYSPVSFLTSPQCVCGLIMYFCLLTHDPHNPFGDPSLVWLNIKQPQVHAGQNYFVLCVARCCVAVCHDTDDDAYSSSYVYPVLAVCVICADCCSKMFTSASMDQLNLFVFPCVCVCHCVLCQKKLPLCRSSGS